MTSKVSGRKQQTPKTVIPTHRDKYGISDMGAANNVVGSNTIPLPNNIRLSGKKR